MDFTDCRSEVASLYEDALDGGSSSTKKLWTYIFQHCATEVGCNVITGSCPTLYPDAPRFDILVERATDSIPLLLCLVRKRISRHKKQSYGALEDEIAERYEALLQQSGSDTAYLMTCAGPDFRRWWWHGDSRKLCALDGSSRRGVADLYTDVRETLLWVTSLFTPMRPRATPDEAIANVEPRPMEQAEAAPVTYGDQLQVANVQDTNNSAHGYTSEPLKEATPMQLYYLEKYGVPDVLQDDAASSQSVASVENHWKSVWVEKNSKAWIVTLENGRKKQTKRRDWTMENGCYTWLYKGQRYVARFKDPIAPTPRTINIQVNIGRGGSSVSYNGFPYTSQG
ncbi:hypothetical protein LIA77_11777 [Sarocladium implicatum]|nr:hypothetical protein LIA77_11777 [Sarocladium implicatum]